MIIDSNYIREIRDISSNVDDVKRIDPYIEEAEKEWVIPSIGAKLYKDLIDKVESENNTTLLEGGYYNGDTAYLSGLKKAIAYLAYSRYVRNSHAQGGVTFRGDNGQVFEAEGGENVYIMKKTASAEINALSALNEAHGGNSFGTSGLYKFAVIILSYLSSTLVIN